MSAAHDAYFAEVEERFDSAVDFTVGLEEEFQLLDPESLALVNRFEEVRDAARGELAEHIAGELISSEIEVITGRCDGFGAAADKLLLRRRTLCDLAESLGVALGATGTHPFSSWKDQRVIDTPHYRLVEDGLKYVAWRNNTWSAHVHVGLHGRDRAIALCDSLRGYLPHLLALSANSPFIEGVWSQLHSARTQTFVRMFPRCGIPEAFGTWDEHRRYYELLLDTHCIRDFTQIWWSIRPHHRFGTVELRICDVQTEAWQALAINGLAFGLVAALAHRYDEGRPLPVLPGRYIEENLWRAIRSGLDGKLVDFERRREIDAADAIRELVELVQPEADELGLHPFIADVERILREGNGSQRQVKAHLEGETLEQVFAGTVARVRPAQPQDTATGEEGRR